MMRASLVLLQALLVAVRELAMQQVSLLTFVFVGFAAAASPGPDVMLTLANGARRGLKGASLGVMGTVVSHATAIGLISLGVGALSAAPSIDLVAIRWAGVLYLSIVGLLLLRSCDARAGDACNERPGSCPVASTFWRCFTVALTNPKSWLFFLAFMPQFVSADGSQAFQYARLAGGYAAIETVVLVGYAALAASARSFLGRFGTARIDKACGGVLLALAGLVTVDQLGTVFGTFR